MTEFVPRIRASALRHCPLCVGAVAFHQDAVNCPTGCHYLVCASCGTFFDLSEQADPNNDSATLAELQVRIAGRWNGLQEQTLQASTKRLRCACCDDMLAAEAASEAATAHLKGIAATASPDA